MKNSWLKMWTRETLGFLSVLNAAERGVWFSILCQLAESDERGKRTMPRRRWAAACGCNEEHFERVLKVLRAERAFDFEEAAEEGLTVISRRMVRETRELEQHVQRQRRYTKNNDGINDGTNDGINDAKMTPEKKEERYKESTTTKVVVQKKEKPPLRVRFVPPTLDEVKSYIAENGYAVNAERWHAYYEANGWRVGRNPMKDWKAAVRTWATNGRNGEKTGKCGFQPIAETPEEAHKGDFWAGTQFAEKEACA